MAFYVFANILLTHSGLIQREKQNLPNLVVQSPSYRHPFQSLGLTLLSWKRIPPKLLKPTNDKPLENEHWDRNSPVIEMHMPWMAKKILNYEKFDIPMFVIYYIIAKMPYLQNTHASIWCWKTAYPWLFTLVSRGTAIIKSWLRSTLKTKQV